MFHLLSITDATDEIIVIISSTISIFFVSLVLGIMYLVTIQRVLNAVSSENRKIAPGYAWLLLIPFFNIVWHFFLADKIAGSLRAEFDKRNMLATDLISGYDIGMAFPFLLLLQGFVLIIHPFTPSGTLFTVILLILSTLGSLICWIIYWVKINDYKNMLLRNNLATLIGTPNT